MNVSQQVARLEEVIAGIKIAVDSRAGLRPQVGAWMTVGGDRGYASSVTSKIWTKHRRRHDAPTLKMVHEEAALLFASD